MKITITLFAFILLPALSTNAQDEMKAATMDNPDDLIISESQVSEYLNTFSVFDVITVSEMKIADKENFYFLLVSDANSGFVYAIPLTRQDSYLVIIPRDELSACESDVLELSRFNVTDEGIVGCKKCNHKVMGKS